jgi:AraC-like DNA-binding protein
MSKLARLLEGLELDEGLTPSRLAGVSFFKTAHRLPRIPLIYDPGIYVVAQGYKIGYLGDRQIRYDADNYLVVSVATPFECEAFASSEEPVTGLYLGMNIPMLHELALRISQETAYRRCSDNPPSSLDSARMDPEMADAAVRLVNHLKSGIEAELLGPGVVKEIFYRVLTGSQSPSFFALLNQNCNFSRIAGTLKVIHRDYMKKLDVECLAETANMSLSTYHRAFKEITTDSPMQYLKKVRLNKARDLLLQEQTKAYVAAEKVGYESQSQFSREFKRYFGQGPADLVREIRTNATAPSD